MKVTKTNEQVITDLTLKQTEVLKEYLTFDNPAYKNALRYSRRKYVYIPKYLMYYSNDMKVHEFRVPIGVNLEEVLNTSEIAYNDLRSVKTASYPPFLLELRKDQQRASEAYLNEQTKEYPKNMIQLPTGKGKTILALYLAQKLGMKTLVLVHKDDLVVGWKKDIQECFGDINIGLIKAKSRKIGEQITIATVQTLNRMGEEEFTKYANEFGLVIQDECHHIALNMFNIIGKFNSRYKLGLSATPKRTDGLDFTFNIFLGGLAYKYDPKDAGEDEDIAQVEIRTIESAFRYKPFLHKGQVFNYYDFAEKDLPTNYTFLEEMDYEKRPRVPYLTIDNEAVTDELTGIPVCKKIVEEYKQGHSIIVMFTQKEHIDLYYDYLSDFIPEERMMKFYGDSKESNDEMLKKAEEGEVKVTLATYAKATEGTNVKAWEVLFLVSSLNNEKNVEQATGRIRRKKEGKLNPVRVYDVRYSGCYSLRSHYSTRLKAYKRLNYLLNEGKKTLFTRGYV